MLSWSLDDLSFSPVHFPPPFVSLSLLYKVKITCKMEIQDFRWILTLFSSSLCPLWEEDCPPKLSRTCKIPCTLGLTQLLGLLSTSNLGVSSSENCSLRTPTVRLLSFILFTSHVFSELAERLSSLAYTLPASTSSRQVSHTFSPAGSGCSEV